LENLKIYSQLHLWAVMVKEVCSRPRITIKMHNIKFMKRTMP